VAWASVVLAALGLPAVGGDVLVMGARSRRLEQAIGFLGGRVVRVPRPAEESSTVQIPAPSGSMASAILETGLAGAVPPGAGTDGATRLLEEVMRVLVPGGTLVLRAPNRHGLTSLAGRTGPHCRVPWLTALPRRAAGWVTRALRMQPCEHHTYSLREYMHHLASAGFGDVRCHAPWPHHDRVALVICNVDGAPLVLPTDTRLTSLMGRVLRSLPARGLRRNAMPEYYLIARKPGTPTTTVMERVLGDDADAPNVEIGFRPRTRSLFVMGAQSFIKFPLTVLGRERLRAEFQALQHLQHTRLAPYVLGETRFEEHGKLGWSVYPLVRPSPGSAMPMSSRLDQSYDLLLQPRAFAPLDSTVSWRRIVSNPALARLDLAGGRDVAELLAHLAAHKRTAVGMIHGDLQDTNLLSRDGDLLIIDWDHFEDPAPLVLDVFPMAMRSVSGRSRTEKPWVEYGHRLRRLFGRTARVRHRERIEPLLGELTWVEAVALFQLSRVNYHLQELEHYGLLHQVVDRYRLHLDVCRSALRSAARTPQGRS
jgi:hypothetical protein